MFGSQDPDGLLGWSLPPMHPAASAPARDGWPETTGRAAAEPLLSGYEHGNLVGHASWSQSLRLSQPSHETSLPPISTLLCSSTTLQPSQPPQPLLLQLPPSPPLTLSLPYPPLPPLPSCHSRRCRRVPHHLPHHLPLYLLLHRTNHRPPRHHRCRHHRQPYRKIHFHHTHRSCYRPL